MMKRCSRRRRKMVDDRSFFFFFLVFCAVCLADADGPIFITSLSLTLDGSGVHASKCRAMDMISSSSSSSFALCRQKTFKKQLGQREREKRRRRKKRFSTSSALLSCINTDMKSVELHCVIFLYESNRKGKSFVKRRWWWWRMSHQETFDYLEEKKANKNIRLTRDEKKTVDQLRWFMNDNVFIADFLGV